jgi:tetratricopeptide (TPR) repeat protein
VRARFGKIFLLLFFGSLGKILGADVVAPTKAEVEAMYSRAAHELNAGNYAETLRLLDDLDQRQPDVAAAQNLRGVALMRMGEFGPAEKALQKARELDPDLWEARFNLAEVPFLAKNWNEARDRFSALADSFPSQAEGATGDLIQFKILLTYLLQNKEKNADAISARLKTSSVSPAFYYAQAAVALWQKDETGAKVNLRAAEKAYSARLNRLFRESFYEIGWLAKPQEGPPATLEVISEASRVTTAQTDFGNAERAFRRGELDRALELLQEVDAIAPNQAASYNLRGEIFLEQGNLAEAEVAFHNALKADPQFQDARLNLATVPWRKGDYETTRKQLESLLGAIAGDKQQRPREQLIRYEIFLTLLREGRESAAQKAMDEFKISDESPALYYAQAAWAYEHGNSKQGNDWVANANNLYSPEMNRDFAKPFADLGWTGRKMESANNGNEHEAKISTSPSPTPARAAATVESSPAPAVVEAPPATPNPTPKEWVAKTMPAATSSPIPSASPEVKRDAARKKPTRTERSTTREATEQGNQSEPARTDTATKRERPERSTQSEATRAVRTRPLSTSRQQQREPQPRPNTASSKPLARPTPTIAAQPTPTPPVRQNLGDKVVRFFLYPFQHREKTTATAAPPRPSGSPSPTVPPAPR